MARLRRALCLCGCAIVLLVLGMEACVLRVQRETASPLPPLFGNFPQVRSVLEGAPNKGRFSFAVIGDTESTGTFERLVAKLREAPLDFAVLLGDCVQDGDPYEHGYFRAECADDYELPFPVFYVVGNHDVSADRFTVAQFEASYGPSVFSMEYQGCLFLFLRVLQPPFGNDDSLQALRRLEPDDVSRYRHRFAFMHIPPPVSEEFRARAYPDHDEFVRSFDRLNVDYAFAGDFHGYTRVASGKTDYIVSGGGGSDLAEGNGGYFHHALVMTVEGNSVAERLLPVEAVHDLEDVLERFAATEALPWMAAHRGLVWAMNGGAMLALAGLGARAARAEHPP